MPRAAYLAAALVALAGCATIAPPPERHEPAASPVAAPAAPSVGDEVSDADPSDTAADTAADPPQGTLEGASADSGLQARIVARARTFLGRRGPFKAAGDTFNGDCSGLAQAVYASEGIDLRRLMQQAAPHERRGVKAAWLAASRSGRVFGAEAEPEPGDLVFWHDTYDRNRNRKADDRFTHLGIVEHVEDGTVSFIHRGGKGVARGVMTLGRAREASGPDGRRINSTLRARSHPVKRGGLAGELFAGYGRIGDARVATGDGARATSKPVATSKPATSSTPSTTSSKRTATAKRTAAPAAKPAATAKRAGIAKKTGTAKRTGTAKPTGTAKATRKSPPTSAAAAKAPRTSRPGAVERTGAPVRETPAASAKPPPRTNREGVPSAERSATL